MKVIGYTYVILTMNKIDTTETINSTERLQAFLVHHKVHNGSNCTDLKTLPCSSHQSPKLYVEVRNRMSKIGCKIRSSVDGTICRMVKVQLVPVNRNKLFLWVNDLVGMLNGNKNNRISVFFDSFENRTTINRPFHCVILCSFLVPVLVEYY